MISRRRFIGITAGLSATALMPSAWAKSAKNEVSIWRGVALGADAELRIYHPDKNFAQGLIQKALNEITRLEKQFSIYRDDSQLAKLNADGVLHHPSADFLTLLSHSQSVHRLSNGVFDPTVQSLWQAYAKEIERGAKTPKPNIQAALGRVGFQHVQFDTRQVRFQRPKMQMTFNGIAQGYITDRVSELFKQAGLAHALVNLGEIRHLDAHKQHLEYAKIREIEGKTRQENPKIPLQNQALATSSGFGTHFDADGKLSHLFHPKTGNNQPRYQSVSVLNDSATMADALSTAFALSDVATIKRVSQATQSKTWLIHLDGHVERFT